MLPKSLLAWGALCLLMSSEHVVFVVYILLLLFENRQSRCC